MTATGVSFCLIEVAKLGILPIQLAPLYAGAYPGYGLLEGAVGDHATLRQCVGR